MGGLYQLRVMQRYLTNNVVAGKWKGSLLMLTDTAVIETG